MEISTMLGAAAEKLVALLEFRAYAELIFAAVVFLPFCIYVLIKIFKEK